MAGSAKTWSKVSMSVQSALATANTITAISKANPGVVTYTGTDPSSGDYALLKVLGMSQVNYRVCRLANVNGGANTAELEGLDTSSFDTFTSGTFEVITFGTSVSIITDISASGGEPEQKDVTTIHDDINKTIFGNFSSIVYSMSGLWIPDDAGLAALKAASDIKALRAIHISWPDSARILFAGYVAASGIPTGSAKEKVSTPISFTAFGRPSMYST